MLTNIQARIFNIRDGVRDTGLDWRKKHAFLLFFYLTTASRAMSVFLASDSTMITV
jgi:hypothetical protein